MEVKLIHLDEVDSTNRYLRNYVPPPGEEATLCTADYQTAGRGCGTNTWESERGQNLLFSLLIHPEQLPVRQQFLISMAMSLAIVEAVGSLGIGELSVKWPNDIYWRDRKLCGFLIENRIEGITLRDSIIGVGLNVNQQQFLSDAPNPVSLRQILGHDVDRRFVLNRIMERFSVSPCRADYTGMRYNALLYRRDHQLHPFADANGRFMAELLGADNDGMLWLRHANGTQQSYAFKEVSFIIQ